MDLIPSEFIALAQIVMIDLVLAGDNAIIVGVVSFVLILIALAASIRIAGFETFVFGIGTLIVGVIAIFYWILQDGLVGGTIGKKALGLRVEAVSGQMDVGKAAIRNISKLHWALLLIDWLVGFATEGDPRQKITDRFAGTTVVRSGPGAEVENQFRTAATPWGAPPGSGEGGHSPPVTPPASSPGSSPTPPQPGAAPRGAVTVGPAREPGAPGPAGQAPRFCRECGGPLVLGDAGRLVCPRCLAVY